jgi:hypothetical protein
MNGMSPGGGPQPGQATQATDTIKNDEYNPNKLADETNNKRKNRFNIPFEPVGN